MENTLENWKQRFETAKTAYDPVIAKMQDRQKQFEGSKNMTDVDGEKMECSCVWNITSENIESTIDGEVPPPKVSPLRKEDEKLAREIEHMLLAQMDRMPTEEHNDICERTTKTQGGVIHLPEWDNSVRTHTTVGAVCLDHVHPKNFIPQPGVTEIDDMDYYFILIPDTKEGVRRKYGVDVSEESEEEPEARGFENEEADDMVTVHMAHYRNERGFVGAFGWVGDTVVLDNEDYLARTVKRCKSCGAIQNGAEQPMDRPVNQDGTFPKGAKRAGKKEGRCAYCGGPLESITEDCLTVKLSELEGLGMSPEKAQEIRDHVVTEGDFGKPPMEAGQPVQTGSVYATMPPDMVLPEADREEETGPFMFGIETPETTETEKTIDIPFFKPESYPAVLQRNITAFGKFLGESDCDKVRDQQNAVNLMQDRMVRRILETGSVIGLPPDTTFTIDKKDHRKWRFTNKTDLELVKKWDFTDDIQPYMAVMEQAYEESRRVLGVTDSFQGRRDPTATSGKAKEISAAQSAGRMESKRILKSAAYQRIYRRIFELMLAYCDEKRPLSYRGTGGKREYGEWNHWDFLKVDDAGQLYWDTDFLFSTDAAMGLSQSRADLWDQITRNFSGGAFGNPQSPEALSKFWALLADAHYPGAEKMSELMSEELEQQKQMQQLMTAMQGGQGEQPAGSENPGQMPPMA